MSVICFAAMEEFAGCIAACRHAASVLGGLWTVIPRKGALPPAVLQSDLLLLSSWDDRYEHILEVRRGPVVPRFHAMIMETELVHEESKLARLVSLLDQGRIPGLAVTDPAYLPLLRRDGVVCLPDMLDEGEYRDVAPAPLLGVNVSLFGAAHLRKNLLAQAAAFDCARHISGAVRWTLHLNGQTRRHEPYRLWLAATGIPFVDHGRLDRARYLALVAGMDAGLCASVYESYCYVAVDHIATGVPVVASAGVRCLGDDVTRVAAHDVAEIASALADAVARREPVVARQRASLLDHARRNRRAALAALAEIRVRAGLFRAE
jgi:glycosyltransferase involved in cell wall biosynthesis